MYVRLNLATRPLISHRRFLVGAALLGLVAGVLFLSLGWRIYRLRKADEDFRARQAKIEQELARQKQRHDDLEAFYARPENKDLEARAKFIGTVIEARSFNWTKMFMDLEHTLPPGAHVLRIEPKLDRGTVGVKFLVGAASQEAKFKLLQSFEESKSFSHVEVYSEELPRQGSTDALNVEFSAIYTGI
jgi:Tfp pilus assembly protein PilN